MLRESTSCGMNIYYTTPPLYTYDERSEDGSKGTEQLRSKATWIVKLSSGGTAVPALWYLGPAIGTPAAPAEPCFSCRYCICNVMYLLTRQVFQWSTKGDSIGAHSQQRTSAVFGGHCFIITNMLISCHSEMHFLYMCEFLSKPRLSFTLGLLCHPSAMIRLVYRFSLCAVWAVTLGSRLAQYSPSLWSLSNLIAKNYRHYSHYQLETPGISLNDDFHCHVIMSTPGTMHQC